MRRWELAELTDCAELVLSELMTNAIQHCEVEGRLIETRFARDGDGVRIEVHDVSDAKPERREASADEESGRGLALVEALTGGQWGASAREGVGKMVWAVVSSLRMGEQVPANDGPGASS